MDFVKMEGLGNDFIVLESDEPPTPEQVVQWCDRRRGIGADGVLRVSATGGATAMRMEYWNADGSPAEMCGNGLRCAARYGYDRGWAMSTAFDVVTPVGTNRAEILGPGEVRVELGGYAVGGSVEFAGHHLVCASVGNPHAVTFVSDPMTAPVTRDGPMIETSSLFPEGTNVEFATVDGDEVRVRVWERGVGETQACGTGAAATAAVAHALGHVGSDVTVQLSGGPLRVELIDSVAWISGRADYVFSGRLLNGRLPLA